MQQAIAVLDSGVGGLTVVKEVMRQLPHEKVIYFGDTARSPYGPRAASEVRHFTRQIVDYLLQFNPKMIVIACNTATAVAIEDIRARVSIPVVGVISPGARAAIKSTRSGMIGVIGTDGTIRSQAYETALKMISPDIRVYSEACPLLAPFVERGLFSSESAYDVVEQSLSPLRGKPIDCLILGCTHYPFLTESISQVMGPEVALISSAEETARDISTILQQRGLLSNSSEMPVHQFFCSGEPVVFKQIALSWLKDQIALKPVVWQIPSII
ncbi:glutamate racemase [Paenibacillus pectinilyticus]|uniref:Glutamate racemase n=1 Tax=Paenibacillus pectinilyticus TaxID=512399 RepID=A0A1C0ZV13_9BACL|nr:glutamate racemase [Paenibacillus pectinilyticus]OCT11917.1 glutamate racemase [Paenibacillus pectinilyticus]